MKLEGGEGVLRDPLELAGDPVLYKVERDLSTLPPETSEGVPDRGRRGEPLKLVPILLASGGGWE